MPLCRWFPFALSLALLTASSAPAQTPPRPSAPTIRQWQDRKFGLFIHFGLYSTLGGVWQGKQYSGNYSEQIESDAGIPEPEYARLASQFNPTRWDPDAIVQLAEEAGMKFIVLTAKHHDGFNLFATHESSFNSVEATPYKKDIVKSLGDACRRRGMPFGVYYSTIDWHFGDIPEPSNDNPISARHEAFNIAQLKELLTGYGPLTEIWFDMGHPTPLQSKHFADTVHSLQPECLIGGRVWNNQGDFSETGDDAIPDYIQTEPWESPASIFADTWGYRSWEQRNDLAGKINEEILRLVKVVSRGGNYILNIGPEGDGSVVPYEAEVLRGTGRWLHQYGEAIYGTDPQPFRDLKFGYATVKGNRLYLFIEHPPADGQLDLPGLQDKILKASWLGGAPSDPFRAETTAHGQRLSLPATLPHAALAVAAVDFAGPLHVVPPAVEPDANGTVTLLPADSERSYNLNGEGYDDPPTVHEELWHFAVKRAGTYQVALSYQPGHFSRLFDVAIDTTMRPTAVYGNHPSPAVIKDVKLSPSPDVVLRITRAAPAERAAKLDVEFTSVVLTYTGPL